jgi:hypothetical protein
MMSITGLSASHPDNRRGILHTQILRTQLALHHRVQVWATSLHRVPKDSYAMQ